MCWEIRARGSPQFGDPGGIVTPGTGELEKRPDSANRNEPQRLMWLEISPIIAHGQELCLSEIGQAQRLMTTASRSNLCALVFSCGHLGLPRTHRLW
jgi:hypothetical protein